jgi:hypothetical protein
MTTSIPFPNEPARPSYPILFTVEVYYYYRKEYGTLDVLAIVGNKIIAVNKKGHIEVLEAEQLNGATLK